jgi:hypothetical protein
VSKTGANATLMPSTVPRARSHYRHFHARSTIIALCGKRVFFKTNSGTIFLFINVHLALSKGLLKLRILHLDAKPLITSLGC